MGEEWENALGCEGGVGDMGEVWKNVWGECGDCVEVGESVLGCGEVRGCGGSPHTLLHLLYTSNPTLHTHPTPLSTLTQHLPHTHLTRFSTLSHTHFANFLTTSTPFPTLPYTLSFTPTKISHFCYLLPN